MLKITELDWLNGGAAKSPDIKSLLEERAKTDQPMDSFSLSDIDLSGINLTHKASKTGYQLTNGDFYKTDFRGAHCFKLDLSGSSLMKADFSGANLHCADLRECNLLGANFDGAKLEHIIWGDKIRHERLAAETNSPQLKQEYYQEAEEIYRHLRLVAERQGLFEMAGNFFQREMVMRRKQKPYFSLNRLLSKAVDFLCGYGEKPIRVTVFSWLVIILFTVIYFFTGVVSDGESIQYNLNVGLHENIQAMLTCLYYSVVTFTTLGYGDIVPMGLSRFWAATEALIGSFTLAVFVVVFVKKMTR